MEQKENVMATASAASAILTREVEHANRVGQAAKDLADKWATLADEENKRIAKETEMRRLKDEVMEKVHRLSREDVYKLRDVMKELG